MDLPRKALNITRNFAAISMATALIIEPVLGHAAGGTRSGRPTVIEKPLDKPLIDNKISGHEIPFKGSHGSGYVSIDDLVNSYKRWSENQLLHEGDSQDIERIITGKNKDFDKDTEYLKKFLNSELVGLEPFEKDWKEGFYIDPQTSNRSNSRKAVLWKYGREFENTQNALAWAFLGGHHYGSRIPLSLAPLKEFLNSSASELKIAPIERRETLFPALVVRATMPNTTNWYGFEREIGGFETSVQQSSDPKPMIAGLTILSALPTNKSEFQSVFNRTPSAAALSEIESASKNLKKLKGESEIKIPETKEEIDRIIRNSSSALTMIIGHNEGGGIKLKGGKIYSITELARKCLLFAKICIFISCESQDEAEGRAVGLKKKISIVEATKLALILNDIAQKQETTLHGSNVVYKDPYQVVEIIRGIISGYENSHVMGVIIEKILVAIIISILSSDDDCTKAGHKNC